MREVAGLVLGLAAFASAGVLGSGKQWGSNVEGVVGDHFSGGGPLGGLEDPVTSLEILYPLDGAMETPPVQLKTVVNIRTGGAKYFRELYADMSICFESSNVTLSCTPVGDPWMNLQDWAFGVYTLQAFFTHVDDDGAPRGGRYWMSAPVTFSVVDSSAFAARTSDFVSSRQTKYRAGFELSLLEWASEQQRQRAEEMLKRLEQDRRGLDNAASDGEILDAEQDEELVLLIGVKTAIATNFALRQAIRETWASKEYLPQGAKVLFVGCRPLSLVGDDYITREAERRRLREAIALEKMVYGDLLTDELDCNDSYLDLANKVKEFLHFAATKYPRTQFVMVADDDVYVRANKLLEFFKKLGPQTRYYSGQVPSVQHARKDTPNRNDNLTHSLSKNLYPLSELPPMAMGAYFFLSMDCVRFVSKNRHRLRDLNGMDDITIPLWMLTIQVHAQHLPWLGFLRAEPCSNNFVAFGDLSPLAFREVHNNLLEERLFCHGFDRNMWFKASDAMKDGLYRVLPWYPEQLQFDFVMANGDEADLFRMTTTISTATHAGIKVSYFQSNETFAAYMRRVCAETCLSYPNAVNATTCTDIGNLLQSKLQLFRGDAAELES